MIRQYQKLTKTEVNKLKKIEKDFKDNSEVFDQYVYWRWFYDIEFFSDYFCLEMKKDKETGEYIDSASFHLDIWKLLLSWDMVNFNIIIARGHGKTTIILIYILRRILYFPWWSIIYVASEWLGKKGIWRVRRELEVNAPINHIFWNLSPKNSDDIKDKRLNVWQSQQLELLNWCFLETLTKGNPVRGARPREILFDDPQENKDVENPAIVRKFNQWAFTSLYNVLLPWWRMVVLWTIVGNLCFVKYLRDKRRRLTIEYQACDKNFGNILWKGMWSKESLIERRDGKIFTNPLDGKTIREKGLWSVLFNQEFRNIPLNKENSVVEEHWIKSYLPPIEFDYKILSVDPAVWIKQKNDFTGLVLLWVKDHKKYVIYSRGVKLKPRKLEEFIIYLNDHFQPDIVIKEDNIEVKLTDDLKAKGLPIKWVRNHKDKMTRLLGVAWQIEVWDVYFLPDQQEKLIEQLTNFPEVEHDDEMDAFVMALKKAQDMSDKKKRKRKAKRISKK